MSLTSIDNNNIFHKEVIGNVRSAQEDSHDIAAVTPNGSVFVVCDGMGGHVGGKQASSIAVKSIIEYFQREKYPDPVRALTDALKFANMQILGYSSLHPELRGMGTTACIVLLQGSEAFIAHIGDSRIYLYLGKEKQLHRITKDHSFVQALVDAGEITDEEAESHPNKNRILKALGVKPDIEPTIGKVLPKNGDIFLICSDGLSGMISDAVIKDVLAQKLPIESKGETLIQLALDAGGLDNITVELIQIAGSPHSKSRFQSYNPVGAQKSNPKESSGSIKWLIAAMILLVVGLGLTAGGYFIKSHLQSSRQIEKLDSLINSEKTDSVELKNLQKQFEADSLQMQETEVRRLQIYEIIKQGSADPKEKESYESIVAGTKAYKEKLDSLKAAIAKKRAELLTTRQQRDSLKNELSKTKKP